MRCLFVIDMQNGFVTPGTRHIVPKIESLFDVKKIRTGFRPYFFSML